MQKIKVEDMKTGQLMNYNWNRMAALSKIHPKSKLAQAEYDLHIGIQQGFANSKTDKERMEWVQLIKETLPKGKTHFRNNKDVFE